MSMKLLIIVMQTMIGILCDNNDLHFYFFIHLNKRIIRNFFSIMIASLELRGNLSNFPENQTYTLLFSYFYLILFLTKRKLFVPQSICCVPKNKNNTIC